MLSVEIQIGDRVELPPVDHSDFRGGWAEVLDIIEYGGGRETDVLLRLDDDVVWPRREIYWGLEDLIEDALKIERKKKEEEMTTRTQVEEYRGTKMPFSKLKPGMKVTSIHNRFTVYRVLSKHNGTKTVTILAASPETGSVFQSVYQVEADVLEVLEPDPIEQIHPMLARNVESFKTKSLDDLLADKNWALEEKFDGERQILTYLPHGCSGWGDFSKSEDFIQAADFAPLFRASTRVVGKNTGLLATNSKKLPHLADLPVPQDGPTVFDCELMHPEGFQTLRSIMGSNTDLALSKQEKFGKVRAVLFDVLWFNGRDLRQVGFQARRRVLESWWNEVVEWLDSTGADNAAFAYTDLSMIAWEEDHKKKLLDDVLEKGGEGAMLKYAHGVYTDTTVQGQRSSEVLKVKPFQTDEFILLGFEMGKGEYNQDKFGVMRLAQWVPRVSKTPEMVKNEVVLPTAHENIQELVRTNREFYANYDLVFMGTCGGFTEEQEEEFRSKPGDFIGKPVEVKFQSRWKETGQMRHPSFVRMREDKDVLECTYDTTK